MPRRAGRAGLGDRRGDRLRGRGGDRRRFGEADRRWPGGRPRRRGARVLAGLGSLAAAGGPRPAAPRPGSAGCVRQAGPERQARARMRPSGGRGHGDGRSASAPRPDFCASSTQEGGGLAGRASLPPDFDDKRTGRTLHSGMTSGRLPALPETPGANRRRTSFAGPMLRLGMRKMQDASTSEARLLTGT